mmetsp:Transcript_5605/g.11394  ORF Transcript_5605/g.11394 Transcript_5605/m.11394 type:complete len:318 (-) Transcript_5605:148-1101(-)
MRQNTRIDPLRSSIVLWIFLRRMSASTNAVSGTPTSIASLIAFPSFSLASRSASMLDKSTDWQASNVALSMAIVRSRSNAWSSSSCALQTSDGESPTSCARWIASFNTSTPPDSQALASCSRACALGSSSLRILVARLSNLLSAATSDPNSIALRRFTTFRSSIACLSCSSTSLFFCNLPRIPSNSTNSLLGMPTVLALAIASFSCSAVAPSRIACKCSRASCRGCSSASILLASVKATEGAFASSALPIAFCSALTSFSSMACCNFSRAFPIFFNSFARDSASWMCLASSPACWASWIAVFNNVSLASMPMGVSAL